MKLKWHEWNTGVLCHGIVDSKAKSDWIAIINGERSTCKVKVKCETDKADKLPYCMYNVSSCIVIYRTRTICYHHHIQAISTINQSINSNNPSHHLTQIVAIKRVRSPQTSASRDCLRKRRRLCKDQTRPSGNYNTCNVSLHSKIYTCMYNRMYNLVSDSYSKSNMYKRKKRKLYLVVR